VGLSSFTDTKEREQTVDFVTYYSAGTSFYVKASGGPNISSLSDLCGHKVAVEKGTTQQADVQKQEKSCGANKLQLLTFPDQNGANLAISSGRAEVGMADSPVAAYQVKKSNGQFKLSGQPYGTAPYGIALPKGSGLDKPVLAALKKLMADGKYMEILKRWGIEEGAISDPVINGAQS
jgi:polar amino acid transport system substrate-binding protein